MKIGFAIITLCWSSLLLGSHIKSDPGYKVAVEFVLYANQVSQYPSTSEMFLNALAEWQSQIPISPRIYTEDPKVINPFYGPEIWHDRPKVINVFLGDLTEAPYNLPYGVLGIWDPEERSILINAAIMENNRDMTYEVCVHELGHLFGIPHIVSTTNDSLTGFVILPEGVNAKEYIMYPSYNKTDVKKELSAIEIKIAKKHVLNFFTNTEKSKCTLEKKDR